MFVIATSTDGEGRRTSCSRESAPLHADWPPASLSTPPAQQFDQAQDGHLSREAAVPSGDAPLTAEAGQLAGSRSPQSDRYIETTDSVEVLERRPPVNSDLPIRPENSDDQLISDSVLLVREAEAAEQRESGSSDTRSKLTASQETRSTTIKQSRVPAVHDDISTSSECVQLASFSEYSGVELDSGSRQRDTVSTSQHTAVDSGVELDSGSRQRDTVSTSQHTAVDSGVELDSGSRQRDTVSTSQHTAVDSVCSRSLDDQLHTDVNVELQSHCQLHQQSQQPVSASPATGCAAVAEPLTTSGTALRVFFDFFYCLLPQYTIFILVLIDVSDFAVNHFLIVIVIMERPGAVVDVCRVERLNGS